MMNLYIIAAETEPNHVKVGKSANVMARRAQLQSGNPLFLVPWFVASVVEDEAGQIEREAHRLMFQFRTVGEWFQIPIEGARAACLTALQGRSHEVVFDKWAS